MEQSILTNQLLINVCLLLSVIRIYMEVTGFQFANLPLTKKLPKQKAMQFHKFGFYMSVGYFLLFAPSVLLA